MLEIDHADLCKVRYILSYYDCWCKNDVIQVK